MLKGFVLRNLTDPPDSPARLVLSTRLFVSYRNGGRVLDNLQLSIAPGEMVGLVGESGSGKSTLALALLRLPDPAKVRIEGEIVLNGRDILPLKESAMRRLRGSEIALILQSAGTALNPLLRISSQLREAWAAHGREKSMTWQQAAFPLLERIRLPVTESFLRRYPREISIGQAQRVLLAMSLLHSPSLLVADEPTSAVDMITHAEILDLCRELNRDLGLAILWISHDLLSVASLCSRIAILREGRIVECGSVRQIFECPSEEYTRRLVASVPAHPLHSARLPSSDAPTTRMEVFQPGHR